MVRVRLTECSFVPLLFDHRVNLNGLPPTDRTGPYRKFILPGDLRTERFVDFGQRHLTRVNLEFWFDYSILDDTIMV